MFAGMMLGGRPRYAVTIATNRAQWRKSVDGTTIPSGIPVEIVLTINSGIEVQSSSTSVGAIHLDALAAGSEVHIVNTGYLLGCGGRGGDGGEDNGGSGAAGAAAGPAVRADFTGLLRFTNAAGQIYGGGGGGGGGDGALAVGGGGGGGGAGGGAGGTGISANSGSAGTTGRLGAGGAGGTAGGSAVAGGAGGAYGTAGTSSSAAGGAAGYAVLHNSGTTVSWVSGSANIAGSVGA
jgi:hypothetical protein